MKNIKFVFVLFALVLLVAAPLVAVDYSPESAMYKQTGESFMGTSTRVLSMGGAGLGVTGYYDSFLMNPANLGKGGVKISIPSVTVTAYNPKAILESGMIDDFEEGTYEAMLSGAQKFLNTIKKDYGDVLTTDTSVVLTLGSFGFALEAQERLMSYKTSSDMTSTNLIAQITTAATAGLGFRLDLFPDFLTVDLGVSGKAIYKAYFSAQSASSITDLISEKDADHADKFLNEVPLIAGYSFPVNAGVNLNFPLGITVSAVARNFNGAYYMTSYESLNSWSEEVLGEGIDDSFTPSGTFTSESYEFDAGWNLNAGFTWAPKVGSLLKPIIAVDVLDVMAMSGLEGEALNRAFFEQTRLGASLRVLSFLDLRYGLNKGYQSFGVGVDLLIFHLDAAYYQLEYGQDIGDKPIDALSVRFSLLSR